MPPFNLPVRVVGFIRSQARGYATATSSPRHLLSISDLTPGELSTLVRNAAGHKVSIKAGKQPDSLVSTLRGQTIAMSFSKRSTRTRVSMESAVARLGGHSMFLTSQDIQLGVNESLRDTGVVVSSMVDGIVARVGPHSDVAGLAQFSSVPVINALSDKYHPLQTLADYLTVLEGFGGTANGAKDDLGLQGLKIAWVGDANNVLFDLAIGAMKLGIDVAVATPEGYGIPHDIHAVISKAALTTPKGGKLSETSVPEEAVKRADLIVTDTWISMGQEEESARRLKAFAGFTVTENLAKRGGAKDEWKFMHCLPRHPEEVSDEVFYGPRSLVFPEAENRLWSAIAALEGFIVNRGNIQ